MVLTWVVGGLVAMPNLIYNRMKTTFDGVNNYLTYCDQTWGPESTTAYLAYKLIMSLALYLLPMIIIGIFYLFISHHLWSRAVPGTEEMGGEPPCFLANREVVGCDRKMSHELTRDLCQIE